MRQLRAAAAPKPAACVAPEAWQVRQGAGLAPRAARCLAFHFSALRRAATAAALLRAALGACFSGSVMHALMYSRL